MDYTKFTRFTHDLYLMVAQNIGTDENEHDEVTGYTTIYARELIQYAREQNVYVEIVWQARLGLRVYTDTQQREAEIARLDTPMATHISTLAQRAIYDVCEGVAHMLPHAAALDAVGKTLCLLNGSGDKMIVNVSVHSRSPRITVRVDAYDKPRNVIGLECIERLYRIHGVRDVFIGRTPQYGMYLWVSTCP